MERGQVNRGMKFVAYPVAAIATAGAVLGVAAIALGWLEIGVSIGPVQSDTAMMSSAISSVAPQGAEVALRSSSTEPALDPAPAGRSTTSLPEQPTQQAANSLPPSLAVTTEPGGLRVSNQTEHSVRLALLTKQTSNQSASTEVMGTAAFYGQPAHWDFAPGEGSYKGLTLSLPDRNLQLQRGDVLVAFAQDGSRQYWGPYVVGETAQPTWNDQTSEWQLTLQP